MTAATDDPRTSSLLDASAHAAVSGDTPHALRMAQAAWNGAPDARSARAAAARLALLAGYAGDVVAAHQWGDEADGVQGPSAQSDLAVARCIVAVEQPGEPRALSPAQLRDARRLWPVAYWAQGRAELHSGNPLQAVELVRSAEFVSQASGQPGFGRYLLRVLHAKAAWDMGDAARARHTLRDVPAGCAAAAGIRIRLALAIDGPSEARRQSFELAAQCHASPRVQVPLTLGRAVAELAMGHDQAARSADEAADLIGRSGLRAVVHTFPSDAIIRLAQLSDRFAAVSEASTPQRPWPDILQSVRLTPAELTVLHALARSSDRQELAEQLFLSRNTVKTHLRSIYTKLSVRSRDEAIERAVRLGLFHSDR